MAYAYEELMKVSDKFTVAAAFGNVHGVYKPGNVDLQPKILKNSQTFIQEKFGADYNPVDFVFHGVRLICDFYVHEPVKICTLGSLV